MPSRLSALDSSFLRVESPTAHMHVGWVALFSPPKDRPAPSFAELRAHIGSRLCRAPRYRQRLAEVPLGVHAPIWIDDEQFDLCRHVRYARSANINKVVEKVMSTPLDPVDPLWQIWVADKLSDGRIGIVGKAHHCMVDGHRGRRAGGVCCSTRHASPRRPSRTTGSRGRRRRRSRCSRPGCATG